MRYAPWLALLFGPGLGAACASPPAMPPVEARGHITVLDVGGPGGDTGYFPSVLFGADDVAHLAYCDRARGDLLYARLQEGTWKKETVQSRGAVGKHAALALDPQAAPAVAFYDQDRKRLRLARRGVLGWRLEDVDWGIEVGLGAQLRIDPSSGAPHLFYYAPSGHLTHATRAPLGGAWTRRKVTELTVGLGAQVSVAERDGFWASFVDWDGDDSRLLVMRPGAEGRSEVSALPFSGGASGKSFLGFGAGGAPFVIYTTKSGLAWAEETAEGWRTKPLVDSTRSFAAASRGDVVVIAYNDGGAVRLLERRGGTWRSLEVDREAPASEHLAVALDSRGRTLVAYRVAAIRGLKIYEADP